MDVAAVLNNLAEIYLQDRPMEAAALLERALAIRERALGPDHPEVGQSLNNLAFLYLEQGRLGAAKLLFERALAISERALGPDHPEVGKSLYNLAQLYFQQGPRSYGEALGHLRWASTIYGTGPSEGQCNARSVVNPN